MMQQAQLPPKTTQINKGAVAMTGAYAVAHGFAVYQYMTPGEGLIKHLAYAALACATLYKAVSTLSRVKPERDGYYFGSRPAAYWIFLYAIGLFVSAAFIRPDTNILNFLLGFIYGSENGVPFFPTAGYIALDIGLGFLMLASAGVQYLASETAEEIAANHARVGYHHPPGKSAPTKAKQLEAYPEYNADIYQTAPSTSSAQAAKRKKTDKQQQETDQEKRDKAFKEAMKELEALIGMDNVKEEVKTFVADMKMTRKKEEAGIIQEKTAMHMSFMGPAGTGKTTVARIIAKLLYGMGYLSKGHIVETDREGLIAGYIGQTATKTKEKVQKASGGVLFIDEAYALTPKSDQGFEREAIDTLVKLMEDRRDNLVVIFAGYTKEMKEFIKTNSGLQSRVPYSFSFNPYTADELAKITQLTVKQKKHSLDDEAAKSLEEQVDKLVPYSQNQNGRMIRNWVEKAIKEQNRRLYYESPDDTEKFSILTQVDMEKALHQTIEQVKAND